MQYPGEMQNRWPQSSSMAKNHCFFFCWRLLGLIPGGAPFSQLSSGVKDAGRTKLLSLPLLVGQDADVSPFFALRGF